MITKNKKLALLILSLPFIKTTASLVDDSTAREIIQRVIREMNISKDAKEEEKEKIKRILSQVMIDLGATSEQIDIENFIERVMKKLKNEE